MIASYLVRESAMITAKNQSVFSQASDMTVDLSKDVYASSSVIDGVRYIKSLCNVETARGSEYRLILNARDKGPPGSKEFPEVKGWWRDISPSKFEFSAIRVESDGVKLRRITDVLDEESKFKFPHVAWPSPEYPSNKIDILSYDYPVRQFAVSRNVRMTYFNCNAPDVTGYTMVCQSHWVSTIHAHGKEDDAEFYKEVDACFSDQVHVLIYMPVDQGEYITEIQRRWVRRIRGDFFDLVFKTNRARQTIFGSDKESLDNLILNPIMKPSQQGSRIYFNKPRPGPRSLDPPHINHKNPWFTSRCALEGVKDVTLCRDVSLSHRPVIGMLVQYTDGHQERLGEFRFDRPLKTIQAEQSGGIHIDLQRMEDEESTYVEDVRGFPIGDPSVCPEDESWIELSWSGTLEWKFRWADCIVKHIPAVQ
ncbi:hypothetical protein NCS52_01190500 [Fusarium sp. LHS14.1]|nr:hypothetical protein NCS52_01190500 [Fusarium sp. LHS14.1]